MSNKDSTFPGCSSWWLLAPREGFTLLAGRKVLENALLPSVADYLYRNEERQVKEQFETYPLEGDKD